MKKTAVLLAPWALLLCSGITAAEPPPRPNPPPPPAVAASAEASDLRARMQFLERAQKRIEENTVNPQRVEQAAANAVERRDSLIREQVEQRLAQFQQQALAQQTSEKGRTDAIISAMRIENAALKQSLDQLQQKVDSQAAQQQQLDKLTTAARGEAAELKKSLEALQKTAADLAAEQSANTAARSAITGLRERVTFLQEALQNPPANPVQTAELETLKKSVTDLTAAQASAGEAATTAIDDLRAQIATKAPQDAVTVLQNRATDIEQSANAAKQATGSQISKGFGEVQEDIAALQSRVEALSRQAVAQGPDGNIRQTLDQLAGIQTSLQGKVDDNASGFQLLADQIAALIRRTQRIEGALQAPQPLQAYQ